MVAPGGGVGKEEEWDIKSHRLAILSTELLIGGYLVEFSFPGTASAVHWDDRDGLVDVQTPWLRQ